MKCSDCNISVDFTEKTLRRGSSVREPGEALCVSCTSKRSLLVRSLQLIPNTLGEIQARVGPTTIRGIGRPVSR